MTSLLLADTYAAEGHRPWSRLAAHPEFIGVYGKASQGVRFRYDDWLAKFVAECSKTDRLGVDWGFGAFHYWEAESTPQAQADAFLAACDKAKAWTRGTFWWAIDVESGGQRVKPTRQQLEQDIPAFAEAVHGATGYSGILYGGSLLRELGTQGLLGCEAFWTARYEATLPRESYESIGITEDQLFAWQGVGVERPGVVEAGWNLPRTTPIGDADLSVVTMKGGMGWVRERMFVTAG